MASTRTENGWATDDAPPVPDGVGVAENERAVRHRERALSALAEGAAEARRRPGDVALTEALLAIEARLEEAVCYIAQLG